MSLSHSALPIGKSQTMEAQCAIQLHPFVICAGVHVVKSFVFKVIGETAAGCEKQFKAFLSQL